MWWEADAARRRDTPRTAPENPLRKSRASEPDGRRLARASQYEFAVAEALGLDAVIGAQELQESRGVVGAHGAADAQLAEGRSGQTEAYVAMAVEEFDGLAQRGVVELEAGHAPSEPLGDFRCGNRDDGGSGSVGGEIGGCDGDGGAFGDKITTHSSGAVGGHAASFSVGFWSDGVTPFFAQGSTGGLRGSGGGASVWMGGSGSVTSAAGSSQAHLNVQPTLMFNYIIKV